MIFYSAVVILSQILFILCQRDFIKNSDVIVKMVNGLPRWIAKYPKIIGYQPMDDKEIDGGQSLKFIPYLIFFIGSVYIKAEITRWHNDEVEFQIQMERRLATVCRQSSETKKEESIGELKRKNSDVRQSFLDQGKLFLSTVNVKQRKEALDGMTLEKQLEHLNLRKTEISIQYNRIRFSPEFFAYSSRSFWPILDLYANFNHMILHFVILVLTLYWWLNLVNCLHLLAFVIFNIRIGNKISKLKDA